VGAGRASRAGGRRFGYGAGDLWEALSLGAHLLGARDAARALDRLPDTYTDQESIAIGLALLEAGVWDRAHARLRGPLDSGLLADGDHEVRLGLGRGLVELRRHAEAGRLLQPLVGDGIELGIATPARYWSGGLSSRQVTWRARRRCFA
jgi:hypothetical protein